MSYKRRQNAMKYPSEQYIRENGYIVINLIDE